jgi:glycosyltransferase involved in cell wall biosynthesis
MGGSIRHLSGFLPALAQLPNGPEYVFLVRESLPFAPPGGKVRFERVPDRIARAWGRRLAEDIVSVPARLKRERYSAVVSLTNFGPVWTPVPHINFQRNALYFCPYYMGKIKGRSKAEALLRRRLAVASMRRATLVVTPSHAMGQMIRDCYPDIAPPRLQTLYHGFAARGFEEPLEPSLSAALDTGAGARLLFASHAALHKGLDVLLRIAAVLKTRGVDYRIFATIAREDWPQGERVFEETAGALDVTRQIVFLGRVPERQMGALYRACDLMVYPSLCESFGFTMIESMGHSLPIVAADTAVNREICGGGALYYPPLDAERAADAVAHALDPAVRASLVAAGAARVLSFDWSWERYAVQFEDIVRRVI